MSPDQNRCEFLLDQQVVDGNASLARASAPLRRCDAIHSYLRAVANTVQAMRGRSVAKLYRIVEKKRGIWTLAVPLAVQPVNNAGALGAELERHRGQVLGRLRHDNAPHAAAP
jgi:hypothetical protein